MVLGLLIEFYANLFTSSNQCNLERILEGVKLVVTEDGSLDGSFVLSDLLD